jgi:hypothetical protein
MDIFNILGYEHSFYDGKDVFTGEQPASELIEAVKLLPWGDDMAYDNTDFINLDLSSDENALALHALINDEDKWQAILDFQTKLTLRARAQEYMKDPVLFAKLMESSTDGGVMATVAAVKNRMTPIKIK